MSILKAFAEKSDSLNVGLQGRVEFYEHVYNSVNFFLLFFFLDYFTLQPSGIKIKNGTKLG